MTLGELGAFIQSQLRKNGIEVVLSGGASVSIYSSNQYVSHDLDLINIYSVKRKAVSRSMHEIGFIEEGRHFRHSDSHFIIEFPPGPLSIGMEPVKVVDEIQYDTGVLRIISPTDCVKDRLAAYYHWGDRQCLAQAIFVSKLHEIDLEEIQRWSTIEGKLPEYIRFKENL
jgi:hypothetical protein